MPPTHNWKAQVLKSTGGPALVMGVLSPYPSFTSGGFGPISSKSVKYSIVFPDVSFRENFSRTNAPVGCEYSCDVAKYSHRLTDEFAGIGFSKIKSNSVVGFSSGSAFLRSLYNQNTFPTRASTCVRCNQLFPLTCKETRKLATSIGMDCALWMTRYIGTCNGETVSPSGFYT
jgi:hypothetical protein